MSAALSPKPLDYFGTFLVTLATLMYQILLTRIFSVTMWYHFAFMAISLSMLGFTVGAMLVYVFPKFFTNEKTNAHLSWSAFSFGLMILFSYLTQQNIPFTTADISTSVVAAYSIFMIYSVLALPFVAGGICVCLILTRFPDHVSKLYAADLTGSALGCLLVVPALRLTDAPTAVFAAAVIAMTGGLCFGLAHMGKRFIAATGLLTVLLGAFVVYNTGLENEQRSLLRVRWILGEFSEPSLHEEWNEFSRVIVRGDPDSKKGPPFVQGLSTEFPPRDQVRQLMLVIDLIGATMLTQFDGDPIDLQYPKRTVTNYAHHIRKDADVLVIGVGGGKDILSALSFDQKSVTGVEINDLVYKMITEEYGDFVGHLEKDPRVTLVVDEGRSYVARQDKTFDIIQLTFIDTFAASAAGAFVLTENALYTVESFSEFLEHLSPNGILAVSHFYFQEMPIQMYRMTSMIREALLRLGIEEPEKHIMMVRHPEKLQLTRGLYYQARDVGFDDIGTFLISRAPFSNKDMNIIERVSKRQGNEVILSPRGGSSEDFQKLARGEQLENLAGQDYIDLSPPTDDRPFFFHSLKLKGMFSEEMASHGVLSVNVRAVRMLGLLVLMVAGLTLVCVILPLFFAARRDKRDSLGALFPHLIYFTSIGLGFMFIEIALMQRLMIFLGYPTYALVVVLFSLLLSSGIGSFTTGRIPAERFSDLASRRMIILVSMMIVIGIISPLLLQNLRGETNYVRIGTATALIFPLGLFMGMAFPLGMRMASNLQPSATAWFWGVNGAASVCGSVVAVAISLSAGITATYWAGFICYMSALGAFYYATHRGTTVADPA